MTSSVNVVITSAEGRGYVFICACLSVYPPGFSESCERVLLKFLQGGLWLKDRSINFGGDQDDDPIPGIFKECLPRDALCALRIATVSRPSARTSFRPSVTLTYRGSIGWTSSKLI